MKCENNQLKSLYFIYSRNFITKEVNLPFLISEFVDSKGKRKYTHKTFPSHYLRKRKNIDDLNYYIDSLKEKYPNLKIYFYSTRKVLATKDLRDVIYKNVIREILNILKVLLTQGVLFYFVRDSILLAVPLNFLHIFCSVPELLHSFKNLNLFLKNFYSKGLKTLYLLELFSSFCLLSMPISVCHHRLQIGVDATVNMDSSQMKDDSVFQDLSVEEKVDILYDTLENNPSITDDQYQFFEYFREYYEKNPYLDYERQRRRFERLKIHEKASLPKYVLGRTTVIDALCLSTFQLDHYANIQLKYEIFDAPYTSYHEGIHLTGRFPYSFLTEGMTVFITDEFYSEPYWVSTRYIYSDYFVRLLAEVVGSDALLQSYSEQSMGAINDALINIIPEREPRVQLYRAFDKIEFNFRLGTDEALLESYQEALLALSPYVEEKFGILPDSIKYEDESSFYQQYMNCILNPEEDIEFQKVKKYINK